MHQNSTAYTLRVTLDATNPLIDFGASGNADNDSSVENDWVYTNVSVTETNEANITFYLYNDTVSINITNFTDGTRSINWTSLVNGAYHYNVTVRDYAGHSNNTATRRITLAKTSSPSSSSSSSSSGAGGTPSFWKSTYEISQTQLEEGYTKSLAKGHRVKFAVSNETHYAGITSLTNSTATVNISSTPQIATLVIGDVGKFEVSGDNIYDISVTLNTINQNNANITIKKISEVITPEVQQEEQQREDAAQGVQQNEEPLEPQSNKLWLWIVLGAVALLIIVIVISFFANGKKKRHFGH